MAHRIGYTNNQGGSGDMGRTIQCVYGEGRILPADLRAGETLQICNAPKGFVLLRYQFTISDIDSGAGHVLQIGDFLSASRIATNTGLGQSGGTLTTLAATGNRFRYPEDTAIIMTTVTGAAGPLAGTFQMIMEGFIA